MRLVVVGTGQFAGAFIPLFKAHPLVSHLALCDLDAEKLAAAAQKYGVDETYPSLDAACDADVDAVALFTQNWMHAPQAVQALRTGKHVYSAVPTGDSVAEVEALVRAVRETGLIYMLGETSYYYPGVLYCRRRFQQGDFGRVIYAEAEYYHDWSHGLYRVAQIRGGDRWREFAGKPPMHYVTHSTSQVVSVTGARMTHVSCQGVLDDNEDGLYGQGANQWDNPFSNQSALFRMSDGSACRINEFRRIGHPGTVRMAMFGTRGSFEQNTTGSAWLTAQRGSKEALDAVLATSGVTTPNGHYPELSSVHPAERLPREFAGLPSGHAGSHQFLVHDFVTACVAGTQPPTNVWQAARYCLPGLVAHQSAVQGGTLLEIPDFGAAPA